MLDFQGYPIRSPSRSSSKAKEKNVDTRRISGEFGWKYLSDISEIWIKQWINELLCL
jgi:hypothetical protein